MTRQCVVLLEKNEKNLYLTSTSILLKIIDSVLHSPTNPSARTYQFASPQVLQKLRSTTGAMECLFEMGFQELEDKLILPPEASLENVREIQREILSRRNNYVTSVTPETAFTSGISEGAGATSINAISVAYAQFVNHLWDFSGLMVDHENKSLQEKALKLIPLTELQIKAMKQMHSLQRAIKNGASDNGMDIQDLLLLELMEWFKNSFFSWFDTPKCWFCQGDTKFYGLSNDSKARQEGERVEVYICKVCSELSYFTRHKKTENLLETRRGRCGEWAQCFTLMCRSLGLEVRFVYDVTDHVWAEVFSVSQQRWIHCDPCENVCDKPLMYEAGWGKKLSYVIACSYDDIQDVTWRYTCNFSDVIQRRKLCSEKQLLDIIFGIREQRQCGLSSVRKKYLKKRMIKELVEFLTPPKQADIAYEGRTSGSLLWRLARGEISEKVACVWTPKPAEVTAQRFQLGYSCEKDKYFRGMNNENCMSGWQNGVFEFDSVFRKEERDWKMFYLSRTEGSLRGSIKWKFDFSASGLVIEMVKLVFVRQVFENGTVKLSLTGDKNRLDVPPGETTIDTQIFDGSKYLILTTELSGGKGTVAWQHAQVFRQPAGSTTYPFSIVIKLRKM